MVQKIRYGLRRDKHDKKILCVLMAFCMLSCSALAINADTSSIYEESGDARFEKIMSMSAGLTISGTGYARCRGTAFLRPGYNVRVTIALSELVDGHWELVHSWTHIGSGPTGVNASNGWWVDHGTYIVEVTAYVTDSAGNYIESPTVQSYIDIY